LRRLVTWMYQYILWYKNRSILMRLLRRLLVCGALLGANVACVAQDYLIFGGNASENLAQQVAQRLGTSVGRAQIGRFNDGEINIKLEESVRDKDIYIIQSIAKSGKGSVNDNLMELYLLIRTLQRSSAGKITAIIPYYGYARQDRKTESRVPISVSDIAVLLENSGVDRVVAIDLHAGQIQGFFHNVPVDNIYGSIFMAPKLADLKLKDPVIISPDAGGVARAKKFRDTIATYGISADIAMIIKQRAKAGVVSSANLVGDVEGRDVIIVDDICDTGGTLVKAAEELKKFGANKVYANITHPVFSKNAIEKIENSEFEQVFVSDSIELPHKKYSKITQIPTAPLLSLVVESLDRGESLSTLFVPVKTYIEEYGVSKVLDYQDVYPEFKNARGAKLHKKKHPIEVLVTSKSSIKLEATSSIFLDKFGLPEKLLNLKGLQTSSGVSEQPIGLDEAIKGAKNRIKDLKRKHQLNAIEPNRYIVSIESFFSELRDGNNPTDHALVIIENPNGKQRMFLSPGVEKLNR